MKPAARLWHLPITGCGASCPLQVAFATVCRPPDLGRCLSASARSPYIRGQIQRFPRPRLNGRCGIRKRPVVIDDWRRRLLLQALSPQVCCCASTVQPLDRHTDLGGPLGAIGDRRSNAMRLRPIEAPVHRPRKPEERTRRAAASFALCSLISLSAAPVSRGQNRLQ